ncbi:hypothetical protein ACHAWO_008755 [Cyclotella atomus]|uniref:Uncharacterized protein n=1 Tax=Cyclotella atomus TaxID=382360 RepID=A0ABD3QIW6_9STRA
MSRLPNNINDPYRNLGRLGEGTATATTNRQNSNSDNQSYSSLADGAPPNYFQGQPSAIASNNNYASLALSGSSYYNNFGENNYSNWNISDGDLNRRGSNYSSIGTTYEQQQQQPVTTTWVMEQPNSTTSNMMYASQTSNGGQIPVTWNVEPPNSVSQQYTQSYLPPSQQQQSRQNSYAQLGQSRQMMFNATTTHPLHYANNSYQVIQPSAHPPPPPQKTIAIPPPPPPPPPRQNEPSNQTLNNPQMKQPAPSTNQTQKQESSNQKRRRDEMIQNQEKNNHPKKWQPPKKADDLKWNPPKKAEEQSRNHPTTESFDANISAAKWQPPKPGDLKWKPPKKSDEKKPVLQEQQHQVKQQNTNATTESFNANVTVKWHPPKMPEEKKPQLQQEQLDASAPNHPITESLDASVSAINALTALESKWTAPPSNNNKDKKPLSNRQKRRKRTRANKKNKKEEENGNGSLNDAVELIGEWIDVNPDPNPVIDLTGDENEFPPLNVTEAASAAREYNDVPLEQMSKSQLTTYAAVLSRAVDDRDYAVEEAAQYLNSSKSDSAGGDMDISEDEIEVTAVKPAPTMPLQEACQSQQLNSATTEKPADVGIKSHESQQTVSNNPADEKERYRLRLEELRAKKKIADAKLRLAKKKLALGSDDNIATSPLLHKSSESSDQETQGNSLTMLRPSSDSTLPDLTAVRMLSSLLVNVKMIAEPRDKVRYVRSVYQDSSGDESVEKVQVVDPPPEAAAAPPPPPVEKPTTVPDAEELKQKLHLAKLRLELKKKTIALKKKQSEAAPAVANSSNSETANEADVHAAQGIAQQATEVNSEASNTYGQVSSSTVAVDSSNDNATSEESKAARIEELRRRQKELKQSNEVSNLKNLVQRQREILRVKGLELADSSTQLQACINEIKSKEESLAASENKIEDLNHRKRIMEGMIIRATEKLMAARRNLKEKQKQEANAPGA